MASTSYTKKTWVGRLGVGLNKYRIGAADLNGRQTITSDPETVTQEGDAVSADNLNAFEGRIDQAFETLEGNLSTEATTRAQDDFALETEINKIKNGTIVVEKAKKDEDGNNIKNTYATKTALTNMGQTLNQHDARITNLEQKAGDYSIVQYRGTNAVPTGKAKYGLVEKIVGKSRAWNQLAKALNSTNWYEEYGAVVSYSDGVATITPTAKYSRIACDIPYTANHIMLLMGRIKLSNSSNPTSVGLAIYGVDTVVSGTGDCQATTNWQNISVMLKSTSADPNARVIVRDHRDSDWGTIQATDIVCYDLTLIFGSGNEPSTVADALAQLPALGQYNAYDAGSLVDETLSGARSVGVNIWDEEYYAGGYILSDGTLISSGYGTTIASKNYIDVIPSTAYYFKLPYRASDYGIRIAWYDGDKNNISVTDKYTNIVTSPDNARYMMFNTHGVYGSSVYNHDIQVCLNSYADKTTYHPYKTDTLSLSTPVTLRSAGAVSEVLTLETGKKTRPIGSVDMGTLEWIGSNGEFYVLNADGWIEFPEENTEAGNVICPKYVTKSYVEATDKTIFTTWKSAGVKGLFVYDSSFSDIATFKTAMSGIYLNYELATPLSDEQVCDPILDPFIKVEGGGTVETIQTQTPVIDNCLDVGYLAV